MKITIFSVKNFEISYLKEANNNRYELNLIAEPLSLKTVHLAKDSVAIAVFSGDDASEEVLEKLKEYQIDFIAVRATGYDNVDIKYAKKLKIKVANVPNYSPQAIAEHSVCLMLALNRKLIQANKQVHNLDFRLDKLIGFNMHGKTVGIIGIGNIGSITAKILQGFGCNIIAYDLLKNQSLIDIGIKYVDLKTLCEQSDIISIHTSLNENTKYLINKELIGCMKKGVMLINTSRGAVINTIDVIEGLKNEAIGSLGIDVYEKEKGLFFYDHSDEILKDDVFAQLLAFKNVLITSHQAFLTKEALHNLAFTTLYNINCFVNNTACENEL